MRQRTILITDSDMNRLRRLLASALNFFRPDRPYLEALEHELENARVVSNEEMPHDVAVLNSRVALLDMSTGKRTVYKLVFPRDSYKGPEALSVLAPIGTAILGRRVGEVVECRTPLGLKRLKLQEVGQGRNLSAALQHVA